MTELALTNKAKNVMRINTNDLTLKRNYLQTYRLLIKEYEQVKARAHPRFKLARVLYGISY